MTAIVVETVNTGAAIKTAIDANLVIGHRVQITGTGSDFITITFYPTA